MKYIVVLLALGLSSLVSAKGYTGNELTHTQLYGSNFSSSVTVLRRYHKGLFIEGELFNNKEAVPGIGYQEGTMKTLLDIRVNENNVKIFFMKRF